MFPVNQKRGQGLCVALHARVKRGPVHVHALEPLERLIPLRSINKNAEFDEIVTHCFGPFGPR